jgi:cytochrome P450
VVTIYCFFLAMTLFPDAQRKAQEELGTVVGPLRLPTMEDRASLPYVEAVVTEILRWAPIVPMGEYDL